MEAPKKKMGRPPKAPEDRAPNILMSARMSKEHNQMIKEGAEKKGITITEALVIGALLYLGYKIITSEEE